MQEFLHSNADFKFNVRAASIGAQGPDIFFFHRSAPLMIGKSRRKVGSALHRAKMGEILDAFADYCSFSPDIDIAKSYMYGFILHYVLDRGCHPYVYAMQAKLLEQNKHIYKHSAHNVVELSIDTYMLSTKMRLSSPTDFDSSATISTDPRITEEVSHLLSFVIPRVTSKVVSEEEVVQAIKDTKACQKILRDKTGIISGLSKSLEFIFGPITKYYKISAMIKPKDLEIAKKYVNIEKEIWASPFEPQKQRNESFEELYNLSKQDANFMILAFNRLCKGYSRGAEICGNISFLTGTEVK
jgi:hypothetical protein